MNSTRIVFEIQNNITNTYKRTCVLFIPIDAYISYRQAQYTYDFIYSITEAPSICI